MPIFAAALCAASFFAGCGSLDHPNFFATGQDARTYNPQTGRYEWPDSEPSKPRVISRVTHPAPERNDAAPDDGRVFNPQTGRFERTRD